VHSLQDYFWLPLRDYHVSVSWKHSQTVFIVVVQAEMGPPAKKFYLIRKIRIRVYIYVAPTMFQPLVVFHLLIY
jgi:hypothetical protein